MKNKIKLLVISVLLILSTATAYSIDEINFDGINDVLYFQDNTISNLTEITIEAFVKVNSFSTPKYGGNDIWQFIYLRRTVLSISTRDLHYI